MNGIEERLEYLDTTKSLIKDAINETGGSLTNESAFSEYPNQIKHIIGTTIIPQSDLDKFVEKTRSISGFKQLYGTWTTKLIFNGLIDNEATFICPDNPDIKVEIYMNFYNFRSGGTGFNSISGELPILLNMGSTAAPYNSLGHRRMVKVYNNTDKKQKINFRLKLLNSKNEVVHDFSTFTNYYEYDGQGPIILTANTSKISYYMISPPPRALYDCFDEIDGESYFTQNTLDLYNEKFLEVCDRYELTFTSEEEV